jgi:hypothetical protein
MQLSYTLRPATMDDREFMMHLEKENFALVPKVMELFDEEHQKNQYENYFKPNYVCIIEYDDKPIGAVSIILRRKDISIVYLYLLPKYYDLGIDVSLIKKTLKKAKRELKAVMTCVFKGDYRTKRLCDFLGFKIFAEDDLRWRFKWVPQS